MYASIALDPSLRQIRVLIIYPGGPDDHVKCSLILQSLGNSMASRCYTALSYAWGTNSDQEPMTINGTKVQVRGTLLTIIRQLRSETQYLSFWIDAICINQSDEKEKTHQIHLMRDIYSEAYSVCLYLGPGTAASEFVFKRINEYQHQHGFGDVPDGSIPSDITQELVFAALFNDVLRRPWFERLWVVQEVVMSTRAVVRCGGKEIHWDAFVNAFNLFLRLPPAAIHHSLSATQLVTIGMLNHFRNERILGKEPALMFWIEAFGNRLCQNPEDVIFGLLGLAGDRNIPELLTLSYSQPVSQLYTAVMTYHIQSTCNLDAMVPRVLPKIDPLSCRRPSWVPDLNRRGGEKLGGLTRSFYALDDGYYAAGRGQTAKHGLQGADWYTSFYAQGLHDQSASFDTEGTTLIVQGVHAFKITQTRTLGSLMTGPGSEIHLPPSIDDWTLYPGGSLYRIALGNTLSFGRNEVGDRQAIDLSSAEFPRCLKAWESERMRNYVIIQTETHYVGAAPHSCAIGDVICILLGCSVPVVLREYETTGTYGLIGGCYVHGIMDGEALGHSTVRTFAIK